MTGEQLTLLPGVARVLAACDRCGQAAEVAAVPVEVVLIDPAKPHASPAEQHARDVHVRAAIRDGRVRAEQWCKACRREARFPAKKATATS